MENIRLVNHFDEMDTRQLGMCWLWCSDAELLDRAVSAGYLHLSSSRPSVFRVFDSNGDDMSDLAEWNCSNCLDTTREEFLAELNS